MRVLFALAYCLVFAVASLQADTVTPVSVLATSEFGAVDVFGDGVISDVFATDLIDGGGLMDLDGTPDNVLDDYHDFDAGSLNAWHSGDFPAGLPGGLDNGDTNDGDPETAPPVDSQVLEFDLGALHSLTTAHIWQSNQGGLFDILALTRGVDEFEIHVSEEATGDAFAMVGTFNLDVEEGIEPVGAQTISLGEGLIARRVRFDLNSAYSMKELEFVGLSEVRFEGLSLAPSGDFNGDNVLDALDINRLTQEVRFGPGASEFDLNLDGAVDDMDRMVWVNDLKMTHLGDANLDQVFNSDDLIEIFAGGQYDDGVPDNSLWETGDFSGNGEFDSEDLLDAFAAGGYNPGAGSEAASQVPEPQSALLFLIGALLARKWLRRSDACSWT